MTRASCAATVTLLGSLLAFASTSSNGIASRDPVSVSQLAPADEYFGRLKFSPLGIRHKIFALKDDLHHARMRPDAIQHDAEEIEEALDDWSTRFPRDTWLPAAAWGLATLFEELPGIDAHEHAIVVLALVRDKFPGTPFAADAAHDLSRGVGIRPWPHWAGAASRTAALATPAVSPSQPPSPSPAPSVQAQPTDAQSLVNAIRAVRATPDPQQMALVGDLEDRFWSLSRGGTDSSYTRAAWELAARFEQLPGETSRSHAIRLLALLVDRYPNMIFGRWALRDLERGIGERN